MAYRLLLDESEGWIASATTHYGAVGEAPRAARTLRDDYGRWSRWCLGVLAFVVLLASAAVGLAPLANWVLSPTAELTVLEGLIAGVSVVLAVCAAFVLWQLHRSGRRLTRALSWWTGLISRSGEAQDARRLTGAPLLARIVSGTLAAIISIAAAAGLSWPSAFDGFLGGAPPAGALPVWAVVGALCAVGQLGGVMRIMRGAVVAGRSHGRIPVTGRV